MVASYALRVPQARVLPSASFRPRLAAAALAVQLTVPVIRVRRGLPPPSECALPGARQKRGHTLRYVPSGQNRQLNVPYAGIIQIRFEGYFLSLIGTPIYSLLIFL